MAESKLERIRQTHQDAIERAQAAGEIPADKDAQNLSEFLLMSLCGLRVMRKLGVDHSTLEGVVSQTLDRLD